MMTFIKFQNIFFWSTQVLKYYNDELEVVWSTRVLKYYKDALEVVWSTKNQILERDLEVKGHLA
jgi:acyl-CoA thioesterase FadM